MATLVILDAAHALHRCNVFRHVFFAGGRARAKEERSVRGVWDCMPNDEKGEARKTDELV